MGLIRSPIVEAKADGSYEPEDDDRALDVELIISDSGAIYPTKQWRQSDDDPAGKLNCRSHIGETNAIGQS